MIPSQGRCAFPGRERCGEGGTRSLHQRIEWTGGLEPFAGRTGVGGRGLAAPLPGRGGVMRGVHGLRCAAPVATGHRPVGAKTMRSGQKSGCSREQRERDGAKRVHGGAKAERSGAKKGRGSYLYVSRRSVLLSLSAHSAISAVKIAFTFAHFAAFAFSTAFPVFLRLFLFVLFVFFVVKLPFRLCLHAEHAQCGRCRE